MSEVIQKHVNDLDSTIVEISNFLDSLEFASICKKEKSDLENWRTKLVDFYKKVSDLNVHISPLLNDDFKRMKVKFKDIDNKPLEEVFNISEFVLTRLSAYINPISIQISVLQDIEAQKAFKKSIIYSIAISMVAGFVASLLASFTFWSINNDEEKLRIIETKTDSISIEIKKQSEIINNNGSLLNSLISKEKYDTSRH